MAIEIGLSFSTQGFRGNTVRFAESDNSSRQSFYYLVRRIIHNERQTEEIPRGLELRGASWTFLQEKKGMIQC